MSIFVMFQNSVQFLTIGSDLEFFESHDSEFKVSLETQNNDNMFLTFESIFLESVRL